MGSVRSFSHEVGVGTLPQLRGRPACLCGGARLPGKSRSGLAAHGPGCPRGPGPQNTPPRAPGLRAARGWGPGRSSPGGAPSQGGCLQKESKSPARGGPRPPRPIPRAAVLLGCWLSVLFSPSPPEMSGRLLRVQRLSQSHGRNRLTASCWDS